jgi:hypothetical protein
MRELIYYVACSVDGFIAHPDGSHNGFSQDGEYFADLFATFPETVPSHLRDIMGIHSENKLSHYSNKMVKIGLFFTAYIVFSFSLFLAAANTIRGGIVYLFLLLPFYGVVLLTTWIFISNNHTQKVLKIKSKIWSIVLLLQIATLLTSPGNCYGVKQGSRCYSNLQMLIENIPRTGDSNLSHWKLVDDAFFGLLLGYGVSLLLGMRSAQDS